MIFDRRVPRFLVGAYSIDSRSFVFYGIFGGMVIPFISVVARKIGISPMGITLITALAMGSNFLTLIWIELLKNFSSFSLVIYAGLISRLLFFSFLFYVSGPFYLFIITLFYIVSSMSIPASVNLARMIYPDEYRGRMMGYGRTEMAIAWIVSSVIAGKMMDHMDFRYVYALGATFGVLASFFYIPMRNFAKEKIIARKIRFTLLATFKEVFKDRGYLYVNMLIFISGFFNVISFPLYPLYMVDVLKLSNFEVGLLSSVFSLTWSLSYFYSGKFLDKKGPVTLLAINFLISSIRPLSYLVAKDVYYLIPAAIIQGFAWASFDIAWIQLVIRFAPNDEMLPRYSAVFTALIGLRGIIAPFFGTFLYHTWGYKMAFLVSAIGIFIPSLWLLISRKKIREGFVR